MQRAVTKYNLKLQHVSVAYVRIFFILLKKVHFQPRRTVITKQTSSIAVVLLKLRRAEHVNFDKLFIHVGIDKTTTKQPASIVLKFCYFYNNHKDNKT